MPSSAVRTFTDADDYGAAIRQAAVEVTVAGRGDFNATLTRIDLHRIWMQRFSDSLPRICRVASWSGRASIGLRTEPGPSLRWGGVELGMSNIARLGEGQVYYQRTSGPTSYAAMSLPVEEMVCSGATIAGCDLTPPRDTLTVIPPPGAMAKLQRLHAAAGSLAEDAPELIAHPTAAHGLEQALIEVLVGCLAEGKPGEDRSAQRSHALIMRRFRRVVEESPDRPLRSLFGESPSATLRRSG
jgi:hypothetical protein